MRSVLFILVFIFANQLFAQSGPNRTEILYNLKFKQSAGANLVSIIPPTSFSSYQLTLPVDDGTGGQCLTTDGSGVLSWGACGASSGISVGSAVSGGTNGGVLQTVAGNLANSVAGTSGQAFISGGTGIGSWFSGTQGGLAYFGSGGILQSGSAGTTSQWALSGGTGATTFSDSTTRAKTITLAGASVPGTAAITLNDTTASAASSVGVQFTSTGNVGTSRVNLITDAGGGTAGVQFLTGGATPTTKMIIASDGKFSLLNGTNIIHHMENNSTSAAGTVEIQNLSTSTSSDSVSGLNIIKGSATTATSQDFIRFFISSGGTASGLIAANGANTAAFQTSSDSRLKENITPLGNQLDNILALKPSEFDYVSHPEIKVSAGHQIGFIAQDMQSVYIDSVSTDGNGYLAISGWDKTDARLVKAIQELNQKFEDYKATHP